MPDPIEDFLRNHREELSGEDLPEGHLERLQERLNIAAQPARPIRRRPLRWVPAAASIAFLAIIGYWVRYTFPQDEGYVAPGESRSGMALSEVSPEMAEVEAFYQEALQVRLERLEPRAEHFGFYVGYRQQLNALESQYNELKKDLALTQGDERVVAVMIQNYRLRLDILEKLLQELEVNQLLNTSTDENARV